MEEIYFSIRYENNKVSPKVGHIFEKDKSHINTFILYTYL